MIANEAIWITGASSGIGRELALQLAAQGNTVLVSARRESALASLADGSDNIIPIPFDVSDSSSVASTRAEVSRYLQYLDRVIINAGNCEYLDIDRPDWQLVHRVMAVNFRGAINTLEVALPLLQARPVSESDGRFAGRKTKGAHIVAVASLATVVPFPRAEAYGASKAALQYFMDSVRLDLAPQSIDVTVINPGFIKTPLTDKNDFAMPFLMPADVAAKKMLRAIEQRKRQYDFPARLKSLLSILGCSPFVWSRWVAPALSAGRHE